MGEQQELISLCFLCRNDIFISVFQGISYGELSFENTK
jgi:hypothetical protein